jgi:HEAT repeat protein
MSGLEAAFADPDASVRLNAVLSAGISPSAQDLEALVERCATEPDFQVREMLTWALLRLPAEIVLPRVISQLQRPEPQARSQALHTLSKLRDASAWPAVAPRLDDSDPEVRRTAWYAAVAVVPESEKGWLAARLGEQLGRGERETRLSLSRALLGLGEDAIAPVLSAAAQDKDEATRQHAAATENMLRDPDLAFEAGLYRARREVGLGRIKSAKG